MSFPTNPCARPQQLGESTWTSLAPAPFEAPGEKLQRQAACASSAGRNRPVGGCGAALSGSCVESRWGCGKDAPARSGARGRDGEGRPGQAAVGDRRGPGQRGRHVWLRTVLCGARSLRTLRGREGPSASLRKTAQPFRASSSSAQGAGAGWGACRGKGTTPPGGAEPRTLGVSAQRSSGHVPSSVSDASLSRSPLSSHPTEGTGAHGCRGEPWRQCAVSRCLRAS